MSGTASDLFSPASPASPLRRSEIPFSYDELRADVATKAAALAADLQDFHRRTVEEATELGHRLIEFRDELEYGRFVRWIEDVLGVAKSSAYRFIRLAETLAPAALPSVGKLGLTTAYALSAKTTPTALREEVEHRLVAGESLTAKQVSVILYEARARKKMADDEAKITEKQRRQREARKARRERDFEHEREEFARQADLRRDGARRAAAIVAEKMGDELDEVVGLLRDTGSFALSVHDLEQAISHMRQGSVAPIGYRRDWVDALP